MLNLSLKKRGKLANEIFVINIGESTKREMKINLKTSNGGGFLTKRRINLNETAFRCQRNGVSITAKCRLA